MSERYEVCEGDCIASIAFERGFFPNTIWNHSANTELKQKRQDPYVLNPGDVVTIPDKTCKTVDRPSEKKHRFRRKGVPEKFRLQLLSFDQPRANLEYSLKVGGRIFTGRTDAEGRIEHWIPPDAKIGTLTLGGVEEYEVLLGHLDAPDTDTGLRARLRNLGLLDNELEEDEELLELSPEEMLSHAIEQFQRRHGLNPTGVADEATRQKLVEVHGC